MEEHVERLAKWFKLDGSLADVFAVSSNGDVGAALKAAVNLLNTGKEPERLTKKQMVIYLLFRASVLDSRDLYAKRVRRTKAMAQSRKKGGNTEQHCDNIETALSQRPSILPDIEVEEEVESSSSTYVEEERSADGAPASGPGATASMTLAEWREKHGSEYGIPDPL